MAFDITQPAYQALKKVLAERTSPVVAWVGAGISASAGLPSWEGLLDKLILSAKRKNAVILLDENKKKLENSLIDERKRKNYWVCFQILEELLGSTSYQAEIREHLDTSSHDDVPEEYRLLWRSRIQGIISFNLDQFSTRSHSAEFPGECLDRFVGMESKNLASVLQRNRSFVGNVHGNIDNSSTWVFTHDKLNELLSDQGYQNFISTCLISRTIFFVGVSVDDIAIQTHLSRIIKSGINGVTHYWLTSRNESTLDEWSEKLNIRQIIYPVQDGDHSAALECLKDLAKSIIPKDEPIHDPILPSMMESENDESTPHPEALVAMPLEDIRTVLNKHALRLLKTSDDEAYSKYEHFSAEYDEAIDRAWYVNIASSKNKLLGYTLEERISQGSFGDVYRAESPEGERVALKLLRRDVRRDPSMLQAFRRGIRSMRILKERSTPGMVEFLQASEIPAFVAMEWVEGPDLKTAVESRLINDWFSILSVAKDLAKIIYSAHTLPERVLHRDIRPPNIMLKNYWTNDNVINLVVTDFDLSWHIDALEKSIVAKPLGFMAPEQLHRRPKESTRSALVDSFGFGMTLYYMLTTETPVPDQHKHVDWRKTLNMRVRSKACREWTSVPYRILRLIQGATQDQQRNRWDFARILTELEFLFSAISENPDKLPIDYHAEEIAAHAEVMHHYEWDEARMAAVYRSNGLVVEILGNAQSDEVNLCLEWSQTGEENWKFLPKTKLQVQERAKPHLEKYGWSGSYYDASLRYFKITANTKTRENFDPRKLAQGVDFLVQAMTPRN